MLAETSPCNDTTPLLAAAPQQPSKTIQYGRVWVVINPASGNGQFVQQFEKKVVPLLHDKGIDTKVLITRDSQHCSNFLSKENISQQCDAIIGAGGDGTIADILDGLRRNPDPNALSIPIGHIPSGSGNGLAKSLLHRAGRSYGIAEAAQMILESKTTPLDLIETIATDKTYLTSVRF